MRTLLAALVLLGAPVYAAEDKVELCQGLQDAAADKDADRKQIARLMKRMQCDKALGAAKSRGPAAELTNAQKAAKCADLEKQAAKYGKEPVLRDVIRGQMARMPCPRR